MVKGFTLIEIMLVLLIIGITFQFGLPRMFRNKEETTVQKFISRLNTLTQSGVQAAISTQVIQKVLFNLSSKTAELISTDNNKTKMSINIPKDLDITDFYINGKSVFNAGPATKESAFFFINVDGVAQHVKLFLTDLAATKGARVDYEFLLNPFIGRFAKS